MITDARGLYVHIPFCRQKCRYCDFCSYPNRYGEDADAYINRLLGEAEQYKRERPIAIDTLYFGGGTPSLLSPGQLERIISGLSRIFSVDSRAEITLEANPGTLTEEKLRCYRSLGVNRISLGLPTVISTNLNQTELNARYWDRITSRILGEFRPLVFSGSDVRKLKLTE